MRHQNTRELDRRLHALFHPSTVAVVGASRNPGKLGFHVMKSLTEGGFKGRIVPVNPGSDQVMGLPCASSLADIVGSVDLAVIVLPAALVPQTFEACGDKGVKAAVLITAGFKEIDDPSGAEKQEALAEIARRIALPVIGPNTFGMVNLHADLNASFTPEFSRLDRGGVSLVSQSGGIAHLLAFMAMKDQVGLSKVVGLGNRLNVGFSEMTAFLMEDERTAAIALYVEGLEEPRRLMETLQAYGGKKPVAVYKTGQASVGNQASLSHTGSLAGSHKAYEAAFRQAGVFVAGSSQELLDVSKAMAGCPLPWGRRVAVLSGQAGPGMAACDVCEREGLEIAAFQPETQTIINGLLPPLALRSNPVDMGPAWYDARAANEIVRAVLEDKRVDGILLLMMFASANRDVVPNLAELLLEWGQAKPVVACLAAPAGIWQEDVLGLERAGALVNFPTPERAAHALASLWRHRCGCAGGS